MKQASGTLSTLALSYTIQMMAETDQSRSEHATTRNHDERPRLPGEGKRRGSFQRRPLCDARGHVRIR